MKCVNRVTSFKNCVMFNPVDNNTFELCKRNLHKNLLIYEKKAKKLGCK